MSDLVDLTLDEVLASAEGYGVGPEETAIGVQRWRSAALDFGAEAMKDDPVEFWRRASTLDKETSAALTRMQDKAAVDLIHTLPPEQRKPFADRYTEVNGDPTKMIDDQWMTKAASLNTLQGDQRFQIDRPTPVTLEADGQALATMALKSSGEGWKALVMPLKEDGKPFTLDLPRMNPEQLAKRTAEVQKDYDALGERQVAATDSFEAAQAEGEPVTVAEHSDLYKALEDTGEELSLLQSGDLRAIALRDAQKKIKADDALLGQIADKSLWDRMKAGAMSAAVNTGRAVDMLSTALAEHENTILGKEQAPLSDPFEGFEASLAQLNKDTARSFNPTTGDKVLSAAATAAGQMAATILPAGAATRVAGGVVSELGMASTMAPASAGQEWSAMLGMAKEARGKGDEEGAKRIESMARWSALAQAAIDTGTELIFSESAAAFRGAGNLVKAPLKNAIEEGAAGLAERGVKQPVFYSEEKQQPLTEGLVVEMGAGGLVGGGIVAAGATVHTLAKKMAGDPATAAVIDEIAETAKSRSEPSVPLEEPTPAAPTDPRASATGAAENHQPPGLTEPQVNSIPENATPEPTAEGTPPAEGFGSDWIGATDERGTVPETPRPRLKERGADPEGYYFGVPLPKFPMREMKPLDEATGSRSTTLQRSAQETAKAQKDLRKAVPSPARRAAIAVWLEAAGDVPTLKAWEAGAKNKWMKDAAKIAQTATPKEIAVARTVASIFDALEKRGNAFDVLKNHRDNYIPHVWALEDPGRGFGTRSLKKKFAFAKARTFKTFFDGDQVGMKPRTLDIADLVPGYIAEMNRVIADRQFVADILTKVSSEGTPLAIPRGNVTTTEGVDVAHLIHPQGQNTVKDASGNVVDQSAYEVMQGQPALRTWRWRGKDTEGNPFMVNGDLALHPEAYQRIHATLGESGIRKWYRKEGSLKYPKAFMRALDITQGAIKREMFGLLPPFHQVQEGTHAIGHLVNPFWGLKEFDLTSPEGKDAARYVMLLSDKASGRQYFEGVGAHKTLITATARKFGGRAGAAVADVVEGYQKYIFGSYIPRLKYTTYQKILTRNTKRFKSELAKGEVTLEDVKLLSGQQTDAAYGHLNYAMLDRDPTFQHVLQLGLLAPDFLEARARFVGQAMKSVTSKTGNEQFKAIAVLAAVQAGISFTLAQLTGGDWDEKHPFEFTREGRRYTMRSVPEDMVRALAFIGGDVDTSRQFVSSRINPLLQTGIQLQTGLNWRGEKVTSLDTMTELLAKFIPLTARSLPGIRDLTETSRQSPTSPLEQFAGSVGLKISRASPITEVHKLAHTWMDEQKIQTKSVSYPTSKYQQLRYALEDSDAARAEEAYAELRKTMTQKKITSGFHESITHPFTQSKDMDKKFRSSLPEPEREVYDLAQKKRQDILARFQLLRKQ